MARNKSMPKAGLGTLSLTTGDGTLAVTFASKFDSSIGADYSVSISLGTDPNASDIVDWISSQSDTGFTYNFESSSAEGSLTVYWTATPHFFDK